MLDYASASRRWVSTASDEELHAMRARLWRHMHEHEAHPEASNPVMYRALATLREKISAELDAR